MVHNEESVLCLPTQRGFSVIKPSEIIYCEAHRSYTLFKFNVNQSILITKPLCEYERKLSNGMFCRVHKTYLINLIHVNEYINGEGGYVVMSDNKRIEVSRRKKKYFLNKIRENFFYF